MLDMVFSERMLKKDKEAMEGVFYLTKRFFACIIIIIIIIS